MISGILNLKVSFRTTVSIPTIATGFLTNTHCKKDLYIVEIYSHRRSTISGIYSKFET